MLQDFAVLGSLPTVVPTSMTMNLASIVLMSPLRALARSNAD